MAHSGFIFISEGSCFISENSRNGPSNYYLLYRTNSRIIALSSDTESKSQTAKDPQAQVPATPTPSRPEYAQKFSAHRQALSLALARNIKSTGFKAGEPVFHKQLRCLYRFIIKCKVPWPARPPPSANGQARNHAPWCPPPPPVTAAAGRGPQAYSKQW
jgi:hypothetical protein